MIDLNHSRNLAVRPRAGRFHVLFRFPALVAALERQWLLLFGWLLLATPFAVQAQFNYTVTNQTVTITGYTGNNGVVAIPSSINGLPVISIGDYAFSGSSITGVAIPNSVTSIGDGAFRGCYRLTNVTIPNSVTNIGDYAFAFCSCLTNIMVDPLNSTYSSMDGVLFNQSQTTLVEYPGGKLGGYTVPKSVTSIGELAFWGCSRLTSVTIPNSVTSIGDYAFSGCSSLTNITLGSGVTSIGVSAFSEIFGEGDNHIGCPLINVTIPNSVTSIGADAFSGCSSLTSVTIPNSVASIGGGAFAGTGLINVTIPSSVTNIGSYWLSSNKPDASVGTFVGAFSFCTALTSVTISNSVIGDFEFSACTGLTTVILGSGVTSIVYSAFRGCTSLTAINVETNNPAYSSMSGVLFDKSQTTLIEYPAGKVGSYSIPNGVTSTRYYAFSGCSSLTSVTIPNSVTTIEDFAFNSCTSLTNVILGSGVTSIGYYAFGQSNDPDLPPYGYGYWCPLSKINIPNSVTNIGEGALALCRQLTDVTLGSGVTSIGAGVFSYCGLTSITIPNSVSSIGDDAFFGCSSLTSLYFQGNAPSVGAFVFGGPSPNPFDNATAYYLPGTTGWGSTFGGIPTALWTLPYPLILISTPSFGVQTNQFGFTVSWATDLNVVVEAATNSANPIWAPVQTNTLTGGWFYFSDPLWTNYRTRFYRTR